MIKTSLSNVLRKNIEREVKIVDLKENLNVTGNGTFNEKDIERINKYKKALNNLTS